MSVGNGIKFIRVASGLRQGEMAKRLKISQNYLSLIENNKAEPSLTLIRKISSTFGVPTSFLFWEDTMPTEGKSPQVTQIYEHIRNLIHELQQLRISRRSTST